MVQRWRHMSLAAAFSTWLEFTREQQALEQAASRAVLHWRHISLASAFQTWYNNAQEQATHAHMAERALLHWAQMRVAAAFSTWYVHTQEQQRLRSIASHVVLRLGHRLVAEAFDCWTGYVAYRERKRLAGEYARAMLLTKCVRAWRGRAGATSQAVHHAHELMVRVVGRMQHRLLSESLQCWRERARVGAAAAGEGGREDERL